MLRWLASSTRAGSSANCSFRIRPVRHARLETQSRSLGCTGGEVTRTMSSTHSGNRRFVCTTMAGTFRCAPAKGRSRRSRGPYSVNLGLGDPRAHRVFHQARDGCGDTTRSTSFSALQSGNYRYRRRHGNGAVHGRRPTAPAVHQPAGRGRERRQDKRRWSVLV